MPVWLRLDLLDGTWMFSDWARRSLPEKARWMAALLAELVAGTGVAGAIVRAGPAIDPKAPEEEEYAGPGGIVGLRTRLDPLATGRPSLFRCHQQAVATSSWGEASTRPTG